MSLAAQFPIRHDADFGIGGGVRARIVTIMTIITITTRERGASG